MRTHITPLHLQLLLHYHVVAEPYAACDPQHASSEAVKRYREQLVNWNMIEPKTESLSGYMTTAKGTVFIEYILNTPFPECKWVIPEVAR